MEQEGTHNVIPNQELKDFMFALRDALLMIVRYIERKYGIVQNKRQVL